MTTTPTYHLNSLMRVPEVDGGLSTIELRRTAETIAELQLPNGMIQWYPDGHADPWNHVETAMALAVAGFIHEAELGYQWLADVQLPNGGWHNYYLADGIEDAKIDSNCVAYFATGVWHHYLVTGDADFLERMWPTVNRAMQFVLQLQTPRGEVPWAMREDGSCWDYALLTGSSSIGHSLRCAASIANAMGHDRPRWTEARDRLVDVIANKPEAFEPKERWAMDWYYPVLTGAIVGDDAKKRITDGWDKFVMEGKGVRCVSDEPWITAAETCECVMALLAVGEVDAAATLFDWAQRLRDDDGAYFTGLVFPEQIYFPDRERTSYTAAAVILAADAMYGRNPTSGLFLDHD
ncbi:MAG: prenyltransferase [Acidimicrobiales bacterium]